MKKIIGIWDLKKSNNRLGFFLIFLEELLLYQEILKANRVEIFFYFEKNSIIQPFLVNLALFNPFVESLHFVHENRISFDDSDEIFYWPTSHMDKYLSYSGSTLAVQKLWQKTCKLINLISPINIRKQAQEWIKKYVYNSIPIIVHLKNSQTDTKSNANHESWIELFKYCEDKKLPVKFVVIGNDPYDPQLLNCSNVIITQLHGGYIELELALIPNSLFFMGMSSGPCNMAIMSDHPYLIWKHPDHHVEEMTHEFQDQKQFPFANQYQYFIRDWDTPENLIRNFDNLYSMLKP